MKDVEEKGKNGKRRGKEKSIGRKERVIMTYVNQMRFQDFVSPYDI